jgi:hypothetical protein
MSGNVRTVMNTHTNTMGAANTTAAQYRDGQTIRLPKNWTMEFVMNWDADEPYLQAFVYSPRGSNQDGASLNWARHEGTTSGDYVHDIPDQVHAFIMREEFDEYA